MLRMLTRAVVAAVAALAAVDAAGVCYSPFYSSDYSSSNVASLLARDFQQIAAQGFDSVRTYHAQFYGTNVVNAAQQSGLKVAIGIQMVGTNGAEYEYLENDIQAAIWAAKNAPQSVLAIYAGNENLGLTSSARIVEVINRVKNALVGTAGANVPVGTVQTLAAWLNAGDASTLAAASDVVGGNIYPFFTAGATGDMQGALDTQWKMFATKYGGKARLTETGWPSAGGSSPQGNAASVDNAAKYFDAFNAWTQQTPSNSPMYFMMFDVPATSSDPEYERHFGIATSSGVSKFTAQISVGASASNEAGEMRSTDAGSESPAVTSEPTTATPTEAPTPEPTTATPEPTETPEPTTETPEPTAETPEPTHVEVATVQPEPVFDGSQSSSSGSGSHGSSLDDIVFPNDSSSKAGSGEISEGSDGDAGVPPPKATPASSPAPVATTTPAPTTLSPEAQAAQAAAEANSKVARETMGDSTTSTYMLMSAVGVMGVVAVVVIGVYMRRRNNDADSDETRTVAASSIDPRGSTPSVYDDPLGTRFSSIVMLTPNGDGVCIL